jgi:hypothetical protein
MEKGICTDSLVAEGLEREELVLVITNLKVLNQTAVWVWSSLAEVSLDELGEHHVSDSELLCCECMYCELGLIINKIALP